MGVVPTKRKKSGGSQRRASHAIYVYGVGESEVLTRLMGAELPEAIEPESPLDLVVEDRLAAVVSSVPLSDYSEEGLKVRLADPAWMALRAMRHEKVAEHFALLASLVPLRFGSIYFRRESIKQMLTERQSELLTIIERLRGREEWGIDIRRETDRLMEAIPRVSPRLRELAERVVNASPGDAYLLNKKIEGLRSEEAIAEARRIISRIERELAAESEGSLRLRVLRDAETNPGEVTAKLVFLVARTRFAEFRQVAVQLAEQYDPLGFQLELTGPWPAYNFAAEEV